MSTLVLRSEWTKLRSVRSTMWTLIATAVTMLAFGILLPLAVANSSNPAESGLNGTDLSLTGLGLAALTIAALGVLTISGEYRTGSIRTSFLAVPGRVNMLAGKAVVFTVVSLVVTTAAAFLSFFAGQLVLDGTGLETTLGAPGVVRTVVGAGLYLTASGLLGLVLGALIRHTPGAIVSAIALILVLPQISALLPGQWGETVRTYLTSNAGQQIALLETRPGMLEPWAGLGVYLLWIAVIGIVAAVLLHRRDA
ncbi:ABC transporter permease subunit [Rhizohabitans arisaemae]|uniref:ABC transporter permease subunit n=1 Tax=Rhizohabitans arisaemae TaxID=2720610 RepID=UPI0024B20324|nr:ABC transporter permease subunit [Rhizohabitans arisaemae]